MNEYDRIVQQLRQQGERLTIQRQLVIQALAIGAHMTINDVSASIRAAQPSQPLSEPTIYRILQRLKEMEIISQTDMGESGIVYQVIGAARHHHLVCLNCGCTFDLEDQLFDDLRGALNDRYGFKARMDHMAIYGYCSDCATQLDSP